MEDHGRDIVTITPVGVYKTFWRPMGKSFSERDCAIAMRWLEGVLLRHFRKVTLVMIVPRTTIISDIKGSRLCVYTQAAAWHRTVPSLFGKEEEIAEVLIVPEEEDSTLDYGSDFKSRTVRNLLLDTHIPGITIERGQ